jgi:hypothetical protein
LIARGLSPSFLQCWVCAPTRRRIFSPDYAPQLKLYGLYREAAARHMAEKDKPITSSLF